MTPKPNILLLSAYDTPSHHYWRYHLSQNMSQYNWTLLAQPPRHFAWRVRGNSLIWGIGDVPELNNSYDLVIATSMVDITALRGLRPNLAHTPLVVYFHENQFDYPASAQQKDDLHIKLLSIYNAFCADKIVFNSKHNRETFLKGATELLGKMPDKFTKEQLNLLDTHSQVLPVPLFECQNTPFGLAAETPLKILWNHRWEYDKNPQAFFEAMFKLEDSNIPFELYVVGQEFRKQPAIFHQAKTKLEHKIKVWGYQDRNSYFDILDKCNVVVSSSFHEFQGLALQEAIDRGCVPITPDRLAYKEYVPQALRYSVNTGDEAQALYEKLNNLYYQGVQTSKLLVEAYSWDFLGSAYSNLLSQTLSTAS